MKYILILFLSTSLAFGQDVKVLSKGTPAPFDGVLFSKEMEKSIRQIDLDNAYLKQQNASLNRLNDLSNQENDILSKRYENMALKANQLAEQQVKAENASFWKNALYFVGGALITGVISYGVVKSIR